MGGSNSKEKKAAETSQRALEKQKQQDEFERQQQEFEMLLREAYAQGAQEAAMAAKLELESAQMEYTAMGAVACAFTLIVCYVHYALRERALTSQQQEKNAIVESQSQQLALERQRVTELAAVNDASRSVMAKNEAAMQRMKQYQIVTLAKLKAARIAHKRINRRYVHLSVEVKNLRGINGVLNQRFIASTSGAIFMACVAAGFAVSAHGGGHNDVHHTPAASTLQHAAPEAITAPTTPAVVVVAPTLSASSPSGGNSE